MLNIENAFQWFKTNRVLHNINLTIERGEFVALVGGSGCGKSTLLKMILGTNLPKLGSVKIDEEIIFGPSREVGVVYQKYGLYPFLTTEQNVAFGPLLDQTTPLERIFMPWKVRKLLKEDIRKAKQLLIQFGLEHALHHYPGELSGGMQQRVAFAQALIMRPKILLLDEPFGALDEKTREELQKMLLTLYQENIEAKKNEELPPWTVVIITHELDEAFYVSDRVIGLSKNWIDGSLRGPELGATIVWDQPSPVYHPDEPRDFQRFYEMKQELKQVVLNNHNLIECGKYISNERREGVVYDVKDRNTY